MEGRVVIVTGSSRGIGLALARACAARGARVVIHGRDPARIDEVVRMLRSGGRDAMGIVADLGTSRGADALVKGALEAHGRVDVLVNNAAMTTPRAPLWRVDPLEIEAAVATNLVGPLLCARALLAWAVPRSEPVRIVNVSTISAAAPREHATAYLTTKSGLEGFTRALAVDAGWTNVVVSAVALPGHRTELSRGMLSPQEYAELAPPEAAVADLVFAITAPPEEIHGRVLGDPAGPRIQLDGSDQLPHPLGPSPRAREALAAAATGAALERYPEPAGALRELIASRLRVPLEGVVVGGGIRELLDRSLAVFTRPGESAIANTPSWPVLPQALRARRLTWRRVPYRIARGRADHDLDAIAAAIDRSVRVVYLTSPGNPGGAAIDAKDFDRFTEAIPRHVTVIVDEAYIEYASRGDALQATRLVRWLDKPLVVLRTFSKFYGLAGLRVGYAVATPDAARALTRAAPAFPLVRGAEEAAIAALSDTEHARRVLEHATAARAALEKSLDARRIARLISDAPYVFASVPEAPGPRFFEREYAMLPVAPGLGGPGLGGPGPGEP